MTASAAARRGVEVAPLSSRVLAMTGFRGLFVAAALALQAVDPAGQWRPAAVVSGGYLAVTALLALAVRLPGRALAVRCFGVSLLVDGLYVEYQRQALDRQLPTDALLATFLVAVVLLASFRTGLKLAVWQSILMLVVFRGQQTGLFPPSGAAVGLDREDALFADLVVLWVVALATAVGAATNERELRRRRYDAEALARFAAVLHVDTRPEQVAEHTAQFAVTEQGAVTALVVRRSGGLLDLVTGWTATGPVPFGEVPGADAGSALLDLPRREDGSVLALRLDAARDPWLSGLLPVARRIVVVDLVVSEQEQVSVVLALGRRTRRAERRVLEAVVQATATAALAWSRAALLEAFEQRAATDGLTGLANRRTFDAQLAALVEQWEQQGTPFALVLVDVDHFKAVNDRYGHQAGDEVLQVVAEILDAHAQQAGALAARYGGEEFALLLPAGDAPVAADLAEACRGALHEVVAPVRVTASFGVADVPGHAHGAETLVHAADAALIAAKNTGRDRVVVGGGHAMPAVAGEAVGPDVAGPDVAGPDPVAPDTEPVASAPDGGPPRLPMPRRRDTRATTPDR